MNHTNTPIPQMDSNTMSFLVWLIVMGVSALPVIGVVLLFVCCRPRSYSTNNESPTSASQGRFFSKVSSEEVEDAEHGKQSKGDTSASTSASTSHTSEGEWPSASTP